MIIPDSHIRIHGQDIPVVSRKAWGAAPNRKTRVPVSAKDYDYIALHHGASDNIRAELAPMEVLRGYQNYHHSMGWADIFYNLLIDKQGVIYEGRWGFRSHAGKWGNELAICLLGNNDIVDLTTAQKSSLRAIVGAYEADSKLKMLSYHKERASLLKEGTVSACPGRYAIAAVEGWRAGRETLPPVLGIGDIGPAVQDLQQLLNDALDTELDVDGVFGPITERHVMDLQEYLGVTSDGLWGPDSQRAWDAWEEVEVVFGPEPAPEYDGYVFDLETERAKLRTEIATALYNVTLGRDPSPQMLNTWREHNLVKEVAFLFVSSATTELQNRESRERDIFASEHGA